MRKRAIWIGCLVVVCSGGFGYIFQAHGVRISAGWLQKFGYTTFRLTTREVTFLSGNLRLQGTLYRPEPSFVTYPAVVICHGGTKIGRRLALYVMMAQKLAERGYVVLTFDFRGFGDSEDPHRFETFADLDFVNDTTSALTFLAGVPQADPSQLYVVGHSFGAGVAVMAGIRDVRVQRVVSISPGRLTKGQYFGENATDPGYPSIRMSRDMKIDPPIPQSLFTPHLQDYIAEAILDYSVHPPVLLIDGAAERQEELQFLRSVYEQMTGPKGYTTIHDADHYFGTLRTQNGTSGEIEYDEPVVKELVDALDRWFREGAL